MAVFHYLALRASCHATEDPAKVLAVLRFVAGDHEVRTTRLEGHFGNPIELHEIELKRNPDIDAFFRHVAALSPEVPRRLLRELDRRLDEDLNFYLRLGKQEAVAERLVLSREEDAIQVRGKVAAFPAKLPVAREKLRAYLEELSAEGAGGDEEPQPSLN